MLVKLDHFHKDPGENRKYVKPPPSDPFLPSSFMLYKSATAKELDFWKLPWHAYLQDTPSQLASLWKKMQGHRGLPQSLVESGMPKKHLNKFMGQATQLPVFQQSQGAFAAFHFLGGESDASAALLLEDSKAP